MPRNSNLPPEVVEFFQKNGQKAGAIRKALPPKERSAITRKGWATRRKNQRRETAA